MSSQTLCDIFKLNLLKGDEDFDSASASTYKLALYTSSASLDEDTTAYAVTNEVSGTGYTAGGATLTKVSPALSDGTAYVTFNDVTWSPAVFTARYGLVYNSGTLAAVCVLDFGADKTAATTFTVDFPAADANSAIIRLT